MPDEFADALERLDVIFEDFDDMDGLINRLDAVLSPNQPRASIEQIAIAMEKLAPERQLAREQGFFATRFMRSGRTVTQLRDARGRFVTSEERFTGPNNRVTVVGQGNISRFIEGLG